MFKVKVSLPWIQQLGWGAPTFGESKCPGYDESFSAR
jgi:hypothetical protein